MPFFESTYIAKLTGNNFAQSPLSGAQPAVSVECVCANALQQVHSLVWEVALLSNDYGDVSSMSICTTHIHTHITLHVAQSIHPAQSTHVQHAHTHNMLSM